MTGWAVADAWETVAAQLPDAPAQIQGTRHVSWQAFDQRANGIASLLLGAGAKEQDKVAQYLYNCPEYLESVFACFKTGLAPVNTNYRYLDDELAHLWTNADVTAVVFHGAFADRIESVRDRVPNVRTWLWVDDGNGPCPSWAVAYEDAAARGGAEPVCGPWGRDGDHLLLLYTGGTTGMPKGVMWRQDDLFRILGGTVNARFRQHPADLDAVRAAITRPGRAASRCAR